MQIAPTVSATDVKQIELIGEIGLSVGKHPFNLDGNAESRNFTAITQSRHLAHRVDLGIGQEGRFAGRTGETGGDGAREA
ncbi:hypothetical protein [Bradyrhizobium sp. DASA03007]|uniref:hypothetical protein n=1 Tax=unclassified Bradyrhizobium TaxID=2631580 RepID=UPI003F705049